MIFVAALALTLFISACSDDDNATAQAGSGASAGQGAAGPGSGAGGSGGTGGVGPGASGPGSGAGGTGSGGMGSGAMGTGGSGGPPDGSMSFFVGSVGNGQNGGDYGGLNGADAFCQALADAAGSSKTWRAYLSTHPNAGPGMLVHARDRIGNGPWFNFAGTMVATDLSTLHSDQIAVGDIVDEQGNSVPMNEHDIMTGSQADGTSFDAFPTNPNGPPPTCANWTDNTTNTFTWVGHSDHDPGDSWNSRHETTCDPAGLMDTLGSGRIYCFAID